MNNTCKQDIVLQVCGHFVKLTFYFKFVSCWQSMIVRACICAFDWNNNFNWPQEQDEFDKLLNREKVLILKPYFHPRWTA